MLQFFIHILFCCSFSDLPNHLLDECSVLFDTSKYCSKIVKGSTLLKIFIFLYFFNLYFNKSWDHPTGSWKRVRWGPDKLFFLYRKSAVEGSDSHLSKSYASHCSTIKQNKMCWSPVFPISGELNVLNFDLGMLSSDEYLPPQSEFHDWLVILRIACSTNYI